MAETMIIFRLFETFAWWEARWWGWVKRNGVFWTAHGMKCWWPNAPSPDIPALFLQQGSTPGEASFRGSSGFWFWWFSSLELKSHSSGTSLLSTSNLAWRWILRKSMDSKVLSLTDDNSEQLGIVRWEELMLRIWRTGENSGGYLSGLFGVQ